MPLGTEVLVAGLEAVSVGVLRFHQLSDFRDGRGVVVLGIDVVDEELVDPVSSSNH